MSDMPEVSAYGSYYDVNGHKRSRRVARQGVPDVVPVPIAYIRKPDFAVRQVAAVQVAWFDMINIHIAGIIGKFLRPVEVQRLSHASKGTHELFTLARRVHFMHFMEGDDLGTPQFVNGFPFYPFTALMGDLMQMTSFHRVLPVDECLYRKLMSSSYELPEHIRYTHLWVNSSVYQKVLSALCEILLLRSGVSRTDSAVRETVGRVVMDIQWERDDHGHSYHEWRGMAPCDPTPYWLYGHAMERYLARSVGWWYRYVLADLERVANNVLYCQRNEKCPRGWYAWNNRFGVFDYTTNITEVREYIDARVLAGSRLHSLEPAFFGPHFALECGEELESEDDTVTHVSETETEAMDYV